MDRGIESQPPQDPLLVRKEGLFLQILRDRLVHGVVQLVRRDWASPPRHGTGGAVDGTEACVPHRVLPERTHRVLPEWVLVSGPTLRCASEQQKVLQTPLLGRPFRCRRSRRTREKGGLGRWPLLGQLFLFFLPRIGRDPVWGQRPGPSPARIRTLQPLSASGLAGLCAPPSVLDCCFERVAFLSRSRRKHASGLRSRSPGRWRERALRRHQS